MQSWTYISVFLKRHFINKPEGGVIMISVKNLSHTYGNHGKLAVNNISFEVEKGETFGFLGPSGAGKSTTQGILTGLLKLQTGQVTVAGYDIRKVQKERFNKIGVSFEQSNVYSKLTAKENLEFYAKLFDVPTRGALELINLVGLSGKENDRAGTFSKGMKHRLTFARSMINNPELWFLDEPTTGLDPAISVIIKDIIKEKTSAGTTAFLTTHNMYIADELCDRVAFIIDGEIVLIDTPKNLKMQYGKKFVDIEYIKDGEVVKETLKIIEENDRHRIGEIVNKYDVQTMHTKEATLEEIFIQVQERGLYRMKLLSSYIKEMKIAARGFYFYIEIFMALLMLVILLIGVKEFPESKIKEFVYYDMSDVLKTNLIQKDVESGALKLLEPVEFKMKAVEFEVENKETGEVKLYQFDEEIYLVEAYKAYNLTNGKLEKTIYVTTNEDQLIRLAYQEKRLVLLSQLIIKESHHIDIIIKDMKHKDMRSFCIYYTIKIGI